MIRVASKSGATKRVRYSTLLIDLTPADKHSLKRDLTRAQDFSSRIE